jgi:transmembrane sensor
MSVQRQIERLVVHRAAEWIEVLRLQRTDEYPEFIRWITESPRHLDEFLKLLALSHEAQAAIQSAGIDRNALLARASPQIRELPREAPVAGNVGTPVRGGGSARTWLVALATAAVIAFVWLFGAILLPGTRYATEIGEQRTVHLKDGSVIQLNARSTIAVRLTDTQRDVRLIDGEALFKVAHDRQRPFLVHTRDAVVRAIGTQFDVATRLDGTQVAVIEGKVQVSSKAASVQSPASGEGPGAGAPASSTPLSAGQAARVLQKGTIEHRSAEEAANALAWQERRLVFDLAPLEEIVAEFNRYQRSMQLRLEGIAPGSHHYSGTFDADQPQTFARLLSHERDLSVERDGDDIVIRARP